MKLKNTLGVRTSFRDRPVCECRDRVDAGASGSVKTFDHTVIVGRYNSIGDAVAAASKPPIKTALPRFTLLTSPIRATAATSA